MRKLLSILRTRLLLTGFLLVAAFLATPVTAQAAGFSGSGSGTAGDPYVITTPGQLNEVRNNLSAHYRLGADIDLSGYMNWQPIGSQSAPFTGSLDGGGHTITGLHIDRAGRDYVGLFGYTSGAALTDITLEDAFVAGRQYMGGLVGYMNGGTISGCSFSGSVSYGMHDPVTNIQASFNVGGLAGYVAGGTISGCRTAGSVSGHLYVGGLAGYNTGTILNSHARMTVETISSPYSWMSSGVAGGLVGYNGGGSASISGCSAAGSVTGRIAGGLVGENRGTVSNSFSRGTVALAGGSSSAGGLIAANRGAVSGCFSLSRVSSDYAGSTQLNLGGLIGYNISTGTVSDCFAAGSVRAGSSAANSVAGGLVGLNFGSVARCYAAGGVRGPNLSGGLAGSNSGSISDSFWNSDSITDGAGGNNGTFAAAGKTTAEMKTQAAFTGGWDFSGTWAITEGATYPCLAWQTAFTDFAPPAFAAGYPACDQATAQGFRLKFTLDQDAVVYYAIQDDGAAFRASAEETPDIWVDTYVDIHSDIRGGQKANRMPGFYLPSNRYGSVSVTAGTEATVTITGLAANTPYDVYLLAEDGAGNYSPALIKLDAATVLSGANDITGFTVAGQAGASTIDTAGHTVTFHMPYGTDVTALTPTITVSANATISPASGTAQNFTNPVSYTVTAQDGTPQVWTVTCVVDPALSGENDITGFTVAGQAGASAIDTASHTVTFHMPSGTNVTALTPAITVSANATISPASGTAQDFTSPVSYTVTAQDGTQQVWTVTCVVDPAGDLSGFDVQLAVPGDKTAGAAFDLSITNATGTDGSALSGDINVTVTSSVYGEVHNAPITFTAGTAAVPVILTTEGDHVLTVNVTGVTNPETVNVTVAAAVTTGSISGTVCDDGGGGGGPIEGATVTVTVNGTDYTATTAADGTYTITGVPAGTGYTVTAGKTGYISGTVTDVTVTAGSTTANVNFTLATPVSDGVIAGVAKDSGNNPISGVTVSLSVNGTVYQATTDENGTYTITGVPAGTGYTVTAVKTGYISRTVDNVTVTAGSATTVDFTLTAIPAPVPPAITTQPTSQTVTAGETATFTVAATGDMPLTYQWKKDGVALTDGGSIGGAATATLTISYAQAADAGSYTVVVSNAAGSATSNAATLTVNAAPPANNPPAAKSPVPTQSVTTGGTTTFTASDIAEDADGDSLTITAIVTPPASGTATASLGSGTVTLSGVAAGSTSLVVTVSDGVDTVDITVPVSVTAAPPITYTVSFDSQGGSSVASITGVAAGSVITAPSAPTRTGYTFGGWYKEASCVNAWNFSIDTVTANITLYAKWTYNGGGSGSGGGSSSSTPATPTYKAEVSGISTAKSTLPVNVDTDAGNAATDLGTLAKDIFNGTGTAVLIVPSIPGVNSYTVGVPAASLSGSQGEGALTFSTGAGSVTIPSGMLAGIPGTEGKKAGITIAWGDKSGLPEEVKAAVGDRPVVQLTLTLDGKQTEWNNPDAPVTVSIPYTPTAAELADPEHIVVWYIDGGGNVVSVPNGRYDAATGTVSFFTTHFSYYAVSYKQVSFRDVAKDAWYSKAVSFIAAREITTGTGGGNFSPDAKLTRGQFIVMLMKAYEISPDTNPQDNFADAGSTWYTGYLAAAKRLKISAGVGGNMFAPEKEITRQEMFTMLYNALKAINRLPRGSSGKSLSDFSDADDIAPWAKDAVKLLAETGTIGGSGGKLLPQDTTTRAQMAQVLYNLLTK